MLCRQSAGAGIRLPKTCRCASASRSAGTLIAQRLYGGAGASPECALAAQEEIFRRFWGLHDVLNKPKKRSTYLSADLTQFVRQHKCRRWETLASVAVQHGSDVVALRRLNNLMSDNALRSRVLVYVPGADRFPGAS